MTNLINLTNSLVSFPKPLRKPLYNYTHYYASCFFHAVCIMLSTMSEIPLVNNFVGTYLILPLVNTVDTMTYSLELLIETISELSIDISTIGDAVEVFYKFYNYLHLENNICFISEFMNNVDIPLNDLLISMYCPRYLVIEVKGFNQVYHKGNDYIQDLKLYIINPTNEFEYNLSSVVVLRGTHYYTLQLDGGCWYEFDDTHKEPTVHTFDYLRQPGTQHVLALYVRKSDL